MVAQKKKKMEESKKKEEKEKKKSKVERKKRVFYYWFICFKRAKEREKESYHTHHTGGLIVHTYVEKESRGRVFEREEKIKRKEEYKMVGFIGKRLGIYSTKWNDCTTKIFWNLTLFLFIFFPFSFSFLFVLFLCLSSYQNFKKINKK